MPALPSGSALLVVRPRSIMRQPGPDRLRLSRVVRETVLLGDERQVSFEVQGIGQIVAILGARYSHDADAGRNIDFYAPASEAVLVQAADESIATSR